MTKFRFRISLWLWVVAFPVVVGALAIFWDTLAYGPGGLTIISRPQVPITPNDPISLGASGDVFYTKAQHRFIPGRARVGYVLFVPPGASSDTTDRANAKLDEWQRSLRRRGIAVFELRDTVICGFQAAPTVTQMNAFENTRTANTDRAVDFLQRLDNSVKWEPVVEIQLEAEEGQVNGADKRGR